MSRSMLGAPVPLTLCPVSSRDSSLLINRTRTNKTKTNHLTIWLQVNSSSLPHLDRVYNQPMGTFHHPEGTQDRITLPPTSLLCFPTFRNRKEMYLLSQSIQHSVHMEGVELEPLEQHFYVIYYILFVAPKRSGDWREWKLCGKKCKLQFESLKCILDSI